MYVTVKKFKTPRKIKPIKPEVQKIVTQYIHMYIIVLIYLTFYRVVK